MPLPSPCEQCARTGGYWVERSGKPDATGYRATGMVRCNCERGQALTAQDQLRMLPPSIDIEPRISKEAAALGVSMLSVMKYFPAEEGARLLIGEELRSMCADDSQVLWLTKRMSRMFTEWPGLPPMRAVFWSKFVPLDRVPAKDEAATFPYGVPAELPEAQPQYKRLTSAGSDDSLLKKLR